MSSDAKVLEDPKFQGGGALAQLEEHTWMIGVVLYNVELEAQRVVWLPVSANHLATATTASLTSKLSWVQQ
jgi:hypothetical protein